MIFHSNNLETEKLRTQRITLKCSEVRVPPLLAGSSIKELRELTVLKRKGYRDTLAIRIVL